ncbi:phosphoglycerate mutase-like protein [Nadsonia fulvescens var. elongata DSM 6958]|uniref:Phosphoglycerate mutase-like protein n=1 Tax=Nadsonia fulvescens var. elongata DSM 6958 TaxID=857566 RepID=A0A1E3PFE1_9ASCO|nr:phosphoglycerate mutase-like protein [Nadsonia fulvescens var. elongata DSM 6958]
MQQICAFETSNRGYSDFYDIFNQKDWESYKYVQDLSFYYSRSFGSCQLITIAENHVNTTQTNNTSSFPVDQPFYLDMAHDSDIMYMLTIMDLDFLKQKIPSKYMDPTHQFISSWLVPFDARLNFEVLSCGSDNYIRAIFNGMVLPLDSMSDCPKNSDGLCKVDD